MTILLIYGANFEHQTLLFNNILYNVLSFALSSTIAISHMWLLSDQNVDDMIRKLIF